MAPDPLLLCSVMLEGKGELSADAIYEIAQIDTELADMAGRHGVTLDEFVAWVRAQEEA